MEKAIVKALATVNNQTKLVNTTEARRQATIATSYRTWYSKGTPNCDWVDITSTTYVRDG
jgi:hypothetical protein